MNSLNLFFWTTVNFFLIWLVYFTWKKKLYLAIGLERYKAPHRIHFDDVPRLAGFIYLITLIGYIFFSESNDTQYLFKILLFMSLPISVVSVREDLYHNAEPAIRLMALLFSAWVFRILYLGDYPNLISVPIVQDLVLLPGGFSFFYILSITAVTNGMNLIDGVHGLCGGTILAIAGALAFLAFKLDDPFILWVVTVLLVMLIPYLLFNYPFGNIFLGDVGAYMFGLILSGLTIVFFGRHPSLNPWVAVMILIYPTLEVLFTFLRRFLTGAPIFKADNKHLHTMCFYFFKNQSTLKNYASMLVAPTLIPIWASPLICTIFFYQNPAPVWIFILLFCLAYLVLYIFLYSKTVKLKVIEM
jgi:UDP-N-acetylmuramyl pentapeptide phosphotransferase/UDP-N-acetylglucosamine-1-phosphate transferase